MMMIMQRTFTVRSTQGSCAFLKGKPTFVTERMIEDCMTAGAIPVNEAELEAHIREAPAKPEAPGPGLTRDTAIQAAIAAVVKTNDCDDFGASARPKPSAIAKHTGFMIDVRERDAQWEKFTAAQSEALAIERQEAAAGK